MMPVVEIVVADDHIGIVGYCLTVQLLEHPRGYPIVGVDMDEVFAPGVVETYLTSRTDTSIILMEDAHTTILGGILIADGSTAIGTAVIDKQELEVGMGLGQKAIDTTTEGLLGLIYGDDDGYHERGEGIWDEEESV